MHARVAHERRARLAVAGQQVERGRWHARLVQGLAPAAARWPGDCSAGLSTTALPAARAAPVIPAGIASGKFHGAMTAATPRGA